MSVMTGDFGNPPTQHGHAEDIDNSGYVDSVDISWVSNRFGLPSSSFGHAHVGACVPERDTISTYTNMEARLLMFHNPGETLHTSMVYKGLSQEDTVAQYAQGFDCAGAEMCETTVPFFIDPALFDNSGLQEVRFRYFVDTPDGNRMTASLNFQVYIQNGKSVGNVTRMPYVRGKGWYTVSEYCEGSFLSVPVPNTVSGIWTPQVKVVNHDASLVVSRYAVLLDPDFHNNDDGTIVTRGSGQLQPTTLVINTLALSNGFHRLVVKADCDDPRNAINTGLAVVGFNVSN